MSWNDGRSVGWRCSAHVEQVSGNVAAICRYYECNRLIRAGERDASGVPDYNAVVEVLPAS